MDIPKKDELLSLIYDGRVQAMLKLKKQIEESGAPASVYTAFMKAASEVEAMLPERAGASNPEVSDEIAKVAEAAYLDEDLGDYDPSKPLFN